MTQGHLPTDSLRLALDGLAEVESLGASIAERGIRMAVTDSLKMSRDLPPDEVALAVRQLQSVGALSLEEMRQRRWSKVPKILSRGRLGTGEEYHLLLERVVDRKNSSLSPADREKGARLIAEYESCAGP